MVGRTRTVIVLVLGVLMLAGAGLGGYLLFQAEREDDGAPAEEPVVAWTGYRVLPNGLEITGTRSACQEITGVRVAETRKRIEVTVEVSGYAYGCLESDVPLRRKVRLESPLRDRPVVDGGCLETSDDPDTCLRSEGAGA